MTTDKETHHPFAQSPEPIGDIDKINAALINIAITRSDETNITGCVWMNPIRSKRHVLSESRMKLNRFVSGGCPIMSAHSNNEYDSLTPQLKEKSYRGDIFS